MQLITEPTRITKTSEYLLDLIITDSPGYISNSGVSLPICNVDHHGTFCALNFKTPKTFSFTRKIYNYKDADFIQLREVLSYAPWGTGIDVFDDINDSVKYFYDLFMEAIETFIPNKTIKIRSRDKEWMTNSIRFLIKKRDQLHKRYHKSKSTYHLNLYKTCSINARDAINNAKTVYFTRQIERLQNPETVSKEYHKLCKFFFQGKSTVGIPGIIDNDQIYVSPQEKATVLNDFFVANSTLPEPEDSFALPPLKYITDSRLTYIQFNQAKVYTVLKSLQINKSNGPDNISNKMLKETSEVIAKPLSDLFNKSMQSGKFPDSWKLANVTPIHKKSDRQRKENYRPISLLSCVRKIMEKVIFNEMYKYCESHGFLTWRNAGFKKHESTVNQLLYMTHQIYTSLGNGDDVLLIFLDISKAFDRVYHEGLLHKLQMIGIDGYLLQWLNSYLSDRQQRVVISGQHSEWQKTNAGVPQGSILGPLLFLIFISDITFGLKCESFLYADDTTLFKPLTHDTDINDINSDLNQVSIWADQWRVSFNAAKTKYMIVSKKTTRPKPIPIYFNDIPIEQVRFHCHLGLWFSDNMTWEKQTQETVKKTSRSVNLLKRMSSSITRKTKLFIYKTYIRPKMEYATSVFDGNLNKTQIEYLENVQRQALLCITRAYRHTSHDKLLREAGVEPLSVRRRYFGLCHMYTIINGLTPSYLFNLIPPRVQVSTPYSLRNMLDFKIPSAQKNYIKLSFFWQFLYNWNTLDQNIRQSTTLNQFKTNLKLTMYYKPNKLYILFNTMSSIHHARMRMGLSGLNTHRMNYNFIQFDHCPLCGNRPEDSVHFFLICPYLAIPRLTMMRSITNIVSTKLPHIHFYTRTRHSYEQITNILLYGSVL